MTAPSHAQKQIGILGGSFNPAHEGHIHISHHAKEQLALDEVWWLVCPQNPFKPADNMAPFADRVQGAQSMTSAYPWIHISEFENTLKKDRISTVTTLKALLNAYPDYQFVWLMGADNLPHFHQWHQWENIFRLVPVAVCARQDFFSRLEGFPCYQHYKKNIVHTLKNLPTSPLPAWAFLDIPLHSASSTEIRKSRKKNKN